MFCDGNYDISRDRNYLPFISRNPWRLQILETEKGY
jgi:hypothetical protein